jgi:hypothetical protein
MSREGRIPDLSNGPDESKGLAFRLAAAWALVGIPLAWGVWQVFKKSLDLFR